MKVSSLLTLLVLVAACGGPPPSPTAELTLPPARLVINPAGGAECPTPMGCEYSILIQPAAAGPVEQADWTVDAGQWVRLGVAAVDRQVMFVGPPIDRQPRIVLPGRYRVGGVAKLGNDVVSARPASWTETPDCRTELTVAPAATEVTIAFSVGAMGTCVIKATSR